MAESTIKQKEAGRTNRGSRVVGCSCAHAYQDGVYGKGNRVANGMKNGWRCSVCTTIKKDG